MPTTDSCAVASAALFDNLIRTGDDLRWYCEAKRLGRLKVYGKLDFYGLLDQSEGGQIEDGNQLVDIAVGRLPVETETEAEAMVTLCLQLNRNVMEAAAGVHSCPAFIGCYHERFGTLCYTNAGHTPGLLRDASSITELASTGLPLGLFSHATCDAPTVALEKGALLLLVSRGVVEGKCKD